MFRGADLRYELELDLDQAVFGHTVEIEVPKLVRVRDLPGQRRGQGQLKPSACDTCGGSGQVRISQGFFQLQQTCPALPRRGHDHQESLRHLPRAGPRAPQRTLSVKIPAGVDTGDRIRLTGEGEAGRNGGPPGDLYVEVHVREHAIFERDGEHLSCEVPVSFATAALGGTVEVPTLDGDVTIESPGGDPVRAASSACATRA